MFSVSSSSCEWVLLPLRMRAWKTFGAQKRRIQRSMYHETWVFLACYSHVSCSVAVDGFFVDVLLLLLLVLVLRSTSKLFVGVLSASHYLLTSTTCSRITFPGRPGHFAAPEICVYMYLEVAC